MMLTIPSQEQLCEESQTGQTIVEEIIMWEEKLKEKQNEILKLREDLENEKEAAEEKILNLLEKQKINSPLTAVLKCCLKKEEDLSSQIPILEGRIKAQNDIIVNIQEENKELENINKSNEEKHKDAEDQIILLKKELKDEKEGYNQLKSYVGEILRNILLTHPHILERK